MRPLEIQAVLSKRWGRRLSTVERVRVIEERATNSLALVLAHDGSLDVRFHKVPGGNPLRRLFHRLRHGVRRRRVHPWEDANQRWLLERIWTQLAYYEVAGVKPLAIFLSPAAWTLLEELRREPGEALEVEGVPCRVVPWMKGKVAIVA